MGTEINFEMGWCYLLALFAAVATGSSATVVSVSRVADLVELRAAHRYVVLQLCASPDSGWPLPDLDYQEHVDGIDTLGWKPPVGNDPCVILGASFDKLARSWDAEAPVLFARAVVRPNDWQFMAAVGATDIPGLLFFEHGSGSAHDLARAYYLRVGFPIHYALPLELEAAVRELVRPVGEPMHTASQLEQWVSAAANDEDGELPAVPFVLRWPGVGEPGVEEAVHVLKQWHQVLRVAVVQPAVLQSALAVGPSTTAVIIRPGGKQINHEGPLSELPQWILQNALPVSEAFSAATYLPYMKALPLKPLLLLFVNDTRPEHEQLIHDFTQVAQNLKVNLSSLIMRASTEERLGVMLQTFGLPKHTDGIAIVKLGEGNKYAAATDFLTAVRMERWCEDVLLSRVKPAQMTSSESHQIVPQDDAESTAINSMQLATLMQAPLDHHLLMYFCRPLNRLCQDMAAIVAEISSSKFLRDQQVQFHTFDPSTDDLPIKFNASGIRIWGNNNVPAELASFPVIGYHWYRYFNVPALYMLPLQSQNFVRFEGKFTLAEVMNFVSKHTKNQKAEL